MTFLGSLGEARGQDLNERALAMTGSLGLFWIIGTFHITNFDSEGTNIGNFLSPTILIL